MQYRALLAATALSFAVAMPAFADQPAADQASSTQQAANHDFGKVSKDAVKAFADVQLARLAIYNGNTASARSYIGGAATALSKAKTDDSVFMKAEADLKSPKGITQPNPGNEQPGATAVKWLPIDGAMTLGEDYVATPAKVAGVAKANSQLKSGDHGHAMETLKLAGVNVSFDMAVAPLDKTIAGVDQARQLAASGKYFEANQALKGVQDGVRFDVEDLASTNPGAHTAKAAKTGTGGETQNASNQGASEQGGSNGK